MADDFSKPPDPSWRKSSESTTQSSDAERRSLAFIKLQKSKDSSSCNPATDEHAFLHECNGSTFQTSQVDISNTYRNQPKYKFKAICSYSAHLMQAV